MIAHVPIGNALVAAGLLAVVVLGVRVLLAVRR